jgi:hypothetical protein
MAEYRPASYPAAGYPAAGYSSARLPTLALMTRRLPLAPDGVSIAVAARFVRDTCRMWGVPERLLGSSGRVVATLRRLAAANGGTTFDLVVEARSYTVTVRVRDRVRDYRPRPGVPLRGSDRFGGSDVAPVDATWMLVSSASGDEVWAVAPRDIHPAPGAR